MSPQKISFIGLSLWLSLLILAACSSGVPLKATKISKNKVETTVSTVSAGTVDAVNQAVLSFGTPGKVQKIRVHLGDSVKTGQVLAETENADALLMLETTQQEFKRSEALFKEGLIAKAGFDEARRSSEAARVAYDRTVLRAPFDGIVTELNLRLGESSQVQSVKSPLRVVDIEPRVIKGDIDELDLAKVKVGQKARVRIPSVRPEPFEATVSRVVPFVNTTKEQDRTSQVELRLTDTKVLVPVGASADVEIIVDAKDDALAVPSKLVIGSSTQRHVFLIKNDKLVKTKIRAGLGNYDRTEVLEGVQEGDLVVFPSDTVELKDGLKVKPEMITWP